MKTKFWGCIFGAVMLASALQSCQTRVEIPDGAIYPILFGSTESRAVAGLEDIKSGGFKVYAYFEGNKGSASFAKDVKHAVVEGLDVWSFETPEYWIPDTKYWFKAFYPTELPAGKLTVNQDTSAQNFTIENFDVVNHQVDIMLAEATASVDKGATAPESGSVVNLTFQHLLACIEVQMKSAISNVSITKITLENAKNKATYKDGTWTADDSDDIEITPTNG
ncbi:MAG: fimbrillin family protein, partial [Alistipes sp.]|nr:fimbrillin family protein [Alistipes sp.]